MNRVTMVMVGAGLLLVSAAAAAEMYRWVDADGKVQYSDRPVQGAQEVTITLPGEAPPLPPATAVPDADLDLDPDAFGETPAIETEDDAQVRASLCEQARDRLARLEKADQLYDEDSAGQRRTLSSEERVQAIVSARRTVRELCESSG